MRSSQAQQEYLYHERFGEPARLRVSKPPRTALVICLGIIAPTCAVAVEWHWGLYAEFFLKVVHPLSLACFAWLVPLANAIILWSVRTGAVDRPLIFRLAGLAVAISSIYTLAFLPLLPIAVLAIAYYGIGLAGFIPAATLLIAIWLERHLVAIYPTAKRFTRQGILLALPVFLVASLPALVVPIGLRLFQSERHRAAGVALLRAAADRRDLLHYGCGQWTSIGGIWLEPLELIAPISERSAREAYNTVTGRSFEEDGKSAKCAESGGNVYPPRN